MVDWMAGMWEQPSVVKRVARLGKTMVVRLDMTMVDHWGAPSANWSADWWGLTMAVRWVVPKDVPMVDQWGHSKVEQMVAWKGMMMVVWLALKSVVWMAVRKVNCWVGQWGNWRALLSVDSMAIPWVARMELMWDWSVVRLARLWVFPLVVQTVSTTVPQMVGMTDGMTVDLSELVKLAHENFGTIIWGTRATTLSERRGPEEEWKVVTKCTRGLNWNSIYLICLYHERR